MRFDPVLGAVCAGFLLDCITCGPAFLRQPVRLIELLIRSLERALRRMFPRGRRRELFSGALLVIITAAIFTAGSALLLWILYRISFWAGLVVEIYLAWQMLHAHAIRKESLYVYRALEQPSLQRARFILSRIVGFDTEEMDEDDVIRATIQETARYTTEGAVGPLLFMIIFGAAGGFFYRTVTRLDALIGYRSRKYRYFGRFAAKLDDIVQFLPARIAGILVVLASFGRGYDRARAWRTFLHDRRNHPSPNAAHCAAAMSGALGLTLGGEQLHEGRRQKRPVIGKEKKTLEAADIRRSNRLMTRTSVIALAIFAGVRILLLFLLNR